MMVEKELPKGWVVTKLGEIASYINGKAFKPNEWSREGLPIIRIQNLNREKSEFNYCNFPVDEKFYVEKGDLLFAWSGTPDTSFGAHIWSGERAVLNQHIFRIVINENLISKNYYLYALNHKVKEFVSQAHGTAGLAHITKKKFEESSIPLPPLPEQNRIVAKIEELFSELDNGVAQLQALLAQLKTYRQSVLKWAFEGKMTEELRRERLAPLGSAEELLEQIRTERQARYEADLAAWKAAKARGEKASKPSAPKEFPPLTAEELEGLPELPEGWLWVKSNEVTQEIFDGPFGSNLKSSDYVDKGVRVIRLENIGYLEFKNEFKTYVNEEKYEQLKNQTVTGGDIIFSSFISEQIRTVVLPDYIEKAINKADCFCVRVSELPMNRNFIAYYFSTKTAYNLLVNEVHGATRPRINTTQLKHCPFPLCSLEEQDQIVAAIESRLSACEEAEGVVRRALAQAEGLRQSILKRAFEGRLVGQEIDNLKKAI